MRLTLLVALSASALAAQGTTGLVAGMVRYAHVDGADTSVASGPLGGVHLGFAVGRLQFTAEYAEGAVGDDRHVTAGALGGLATVHPIVAVGLALAGFAHIDADATVRRWWGVELLARVQYQPPATPLTGHVMLIMTPVGGVTDRRPFGSVVGFGAGVRMRVPRSPVTVGLDYRIRRAVAETLRNTVESVSVAGIWTF